MGNSGIKYIKPEDPEIKGQTLRSILLGPSKDGIYRCTTSNSNDIIVFNTVNQGINGMFVSSDERGFGDVFSIRERGFICDQYFEQRFVRIGSAQITVIRE